MNIGIILKIISNIGALSASLNGFENSAKDLFAGKFSEDDAKGFLAAVASILATGIIALPEGITADMVIAFIASGENIAADLVASVKDIESSGIRNVPADLKKVIADLVQAVTSGVINLKNSSIGQAVDILKEIEAGL